MENKTSLTKKAMETRQRLLMATMEQVAKHGYHNITMDEIAKSCGMSTGSAYRYFRNKKEMLIAAIEYCYSNIQSFSKTEDKLLMEFNTLEEMLEYVLQQFYELHKKYYALHEELESLRHIDDDIRTVYDKILKNAVDTLLPKCANWFTDCADFRERLYVAIGILENCAHMQLDDAMHGELDMTQVQKVSIASVISIMGGNK